MSETVKRTIIEGGMIRVIEEKILHQAPLEAALANIVTRTPAIVTNVPEGCKHFAVFPTPDGLEASVVIEEYPSVKNIVYHPRNGERKVYRVHMPFVYFTFRLLNPDQTGAGTWTLNDWRVFVAPHIVKGIDEPLLAVPLPNTSADGRTCEGNIEYMRSGSNELGDICRYIVNTFWTTTFNDHMGIRFPGGFKGFEEWQEAATKDPMQWKDWKKSWDTDAKTGTAFRTIFGSKVRFDDPIITDGMIPSIRAPYTYDQFDEWYKALPKMAQEKFAANVMGQQQFHIRVPERG
jgi:hypothetical protein